MTEQANPAVDKVPSAAAKMFGDFAPAHVTALATARNATPGQVALAWLLARHSQVVPIPGTRRRERLTENAASTEVALSADEIADLSAIAARLGVHGNRYNDLHMGLVGR